MRTLEYREIVFACRPLILQAGQHSVLNFDKEFPMLGLFAWLQLPQQILKEHEVRHDEVQIQVPDVVQKHLNDPVQRLLLFGIVDIELLAGIH